MKKHLPFLYRLSLTLIAVFAFSSFTVAGFSHLKIERNNALSYFVKKSEVSSLLSQAASPISSLSGGTFTGTQLAILSTTSAGASIRYTTDGTDPSSTTGTLYTGPITISNNTVLKSIAFGPGYTDSPIDIETYFINCETPVLSPGTGTYDNGQHVTMSTATAGATIYYTTDGSAPTASSTPYSSRITLNANAVLRAIAIKAGMNNSEITTETYTIKPVVASPTFSPAAGTYNAVQNVVISSATPGALIYYTTDGNTPTTTSTLYTGPITVGTNLTLKAIAVMNGMTNSAVTSASYVILLPVATPTFNPPAGNYTSVQNVAISSTTQGATIYYTTDGTAPTSSSPVYVGPITVGTSSPINAIAVKSGMSDSPVATAAYNILLPVAAPTFTPPAGTYSSAQNVTIASTTPNATIYYTTDGSNPTTSSQIYSGPITIGTNTTLKTIAVKNGMSDSQISSATYAIQLPAAAPTFTPAAGIYSSAQNVTISSATLGATIYYTTDGSMPTTASMLYTGPVNIAINTSLRAIAVMNGMTNSQVTTGNYVIQLQVAAPTVDVPGGTYNAAQKVTLNSATQGATIYYTTDGSTPTTSSPVYTGSITISATSTLQIYAARSGMMDSPITIVNYTIIPAVATPTFNPPAGSYSTAQDVTITTATQGATIYYTTDGSIPTSSGQQYTAPLHIGSTTTLNAIAIMNGMTNSNVSTAHYTLQQTKTANPVFSPAPGIYASPQTITITSSTVGATIKYTTDGSTPSQTNGILYSSPIPISTSTSIKAIAYMTGYGDSDEVDAVYTISPGNTDSDGDGVINAEDEYPLDPARAFNNFFPAKGFGSLVFADNWPLKGDYDMNDMVIDYQINQVSNANNEVTDIKAKFVLRAIGTTKHNGFAIELPVTPSQISSCVVTRTSGNSIPLGNIVLNTNGLEDSNNPKAVVILFNDGFKLFPQQATDTIINTSPDKAWLTPDTLNMTINFVQPVSMEIFADSRIYNPFIFTNKTRGNEIHLPDFPPTSLADANLFNTGDDAYNPSIGRYYKTAKNLPWALNIYGHFDYPIEKVSIHEAYLHFADWVQSNGVLFPDWYLNKNNYRKSTIVYTHQ
ncbi:MAG: chitobiase/beta-hexosaminidase C-terminal domain-containing protein [Bacteroidota bacterium]|nr:chitobiase/beta-hexosaminidase C-terminal domain-containing protein [Bacteroidota bacterium]